MAFDKFRLSDGLLGDVDVQVLDSEFLNDPAYNNGQTLQLKLTMLVAGDDGGEREENFSCGDGWETNDGGKTASREDGREINFNKNSKVGRLFNSLVGVMDSDPAADKAIRKHAEAFDLGPLEAGFWKGLDLHIVREEVDYGGEIGKRDVLVVDGFNGIKGSAPAKATRAAKKAPAKAAKAEGGLTAALRSQLDDIADDSESHDEFMEKAIEQVPEVSSDAEVKAAVADEQGAIWQDALARYNAQSEG